MSQAEVTPQQIFEIAKLDTELAKIIIETFNNLELAINLDNGGFLTLNVFIGQLEFILKNTKVRKVLSRIVKEFKDDQIGQYELVYELHLLHKKWMDNRANVMMSEQAISMWGINKFRFYTGRGEFFHETIGNFSKKLSLLDSDIFTEFRIELRDVESNKTDSCIFGYGNQLVDLLNEPSL